MREDPEINTSVLVAGSAGEYFQDSEMGTRDIYIRGKSRLWVPAWDKVTAQVPAPNHDPPIRVGDPAKEHVLLLRADHPLFPQIPARFNRPARLVYPCANSLDVWEQYVLEVKGFRDWLVQGLLRCAGLPAEWPPSLEFQ